MTETKTIRQWTDPESTQPGNFGLELDLRLHIYTHVRNMIS